MANEVEKEMSQKFSSVIQIIGSLINLCRMYRKEIDEALGRKNPDYTDEQKAEQELLEREYERKKAALAESHNQEIQDLERNAAPLDKIEAKREFHELEDKQLDELYDLRRENLRDIHKARIEHEPRQTKCETHSIESSEVLEHAGHKYEENGKGEPSTDNNGPYEHSLELVYDARKIAQTNVVKDFNMSEQTFSVELNAKLAEFSLREKHEIEKYQLELQQLEASEEFHNFTEAQRTEAKEQLRLKYKGRPAQEAAVGIEAVEATPGSIGELRDECDKELGALLERHVASMDDKVLPLRKAEDAINRRICQQIEENPEYAVDEVNDPPEVRQRKAQAKQHALDVEAARYESALGKIQRVPAALERKLKAKLHRNKGPLDQVRQKADDLFEVVSDSPYTVLPKGPDALNAGVAAAPRRSQQDQLSQQQLQQLLAMQQGAGVQGQAANAL